VAWRARPRTVAASRTRRSSTILAMDHLAEHGRPRTSPAHPRREADQAARNHLTRCDIELAGGPATSTRATLRAHPATTACAWREVKLPGSRGPITRGHWRHRRRKPRFPGESSQRRASPGPAVDPARPVNTSFLPHERRTGVGEDIVLHAYPAGRFPPRDHVAGEKRVGQYRVRLVACSRPVHSPRR